LSPTKELKNLLAALMKTKSLRWKFRPKPDKGFKTEVEHLRSIKLSKIGKWRATATSRP